MHAAVARSTCRSQTCKKSDGFGALLDVQISFCVAGLRDYAPGQKRANRLGFVAYPKTMDLARCLSRGRHNTSDTFMSCLEVRALIS